MKPAADKLLTMRVAVAILAMGWRAQAICAALAAETVQQGYGL